MTATFFGLLLQSVELQASGRRGRGGGGHLRNLSPSNQICDKYSMTHGLMGNTGLCFPELDGRGDDRAM